MGVVSQFLTSSSVSEVAGPGKLPAAGSLYCLPPPPPAPIFMKVAKVSSHQCPQYVLKLLSVASNQS